MELTTTNRNSNYFSSTVIFTVVFLSATFLCVCISLRYDLKSGPDAKFNFAKSDGRSENSNSVSRIKRDAATNNFSRTTGDYERRRRTPNAIIIGVKKGGTRALLEYLRLHPDVKAAGPEVHFFDRHYRLGADWYRQQMPMTTRSQVTLEKTPSYFVTKEAPARIYAFYPQTKLIVVLRNPVSRALSDYAQNAAKRPAMPAFDDLAFMPCNQTVSTIPSERNFCVNTSWGGIKIGLYHKHVRRWLKYFDMSNVHFVNGERLVTHPASETNRVEHFLGLQPEITDEHFDYSDVSGRRGGRKFPCLRSKIAGRKPRCLGKTKGRRHPSVADEKLKILSDFYRPHNEALYKLIGQHFDW